MKKYLNNRIAAMMGLLRKKGSGLVPPVIDVWYGYEQHFGHLGNPQKWINILGRVYSPNEVISLHYSLNGKDELPLSIGPDTHRLARSGDFNIEINRANLEEGENTLLVMAEDSRKNTAVSKVKIQYVKGEIWPLPYTANWSEAKKIQDIAQVVDGLWVLEGNGIRTVEPFYDRIIAIGDLTWTDYELTTSVTFHGHTPPIKGPPNYGVTHAAVAVRWPGHDKDGKQPSVKWYPLGATAEFQITEDRINCRWRILSDNKHMVQEKKGRAIGLHLPYIMKIRVETLPDGGAMYMVKLWRQGDLEPDKWDLESIKEDENVRSGSALLIAHNTIVTFGYLEVVPIRKSIPL